MGKWLWEWFWHPQGMVVWCEANQGLLSTVALAVAIGLVVYEQRRAQAAERQRLTQFSTLGANLIRYMIDKTRLASTLATTDINKATEEYDEARFAIDHALKALIPTSPNAEAAVIVADVTRIISDRARHPFSYVDKMRALADIQTRLEKKERELRALS